VRDTRTNSSLLNWRILMNEVVFIDGTTLDDAWHQTLYTLLHRGRRYTVEWGSYAGTGRLEFDFAVIRVRRPWDEPKIPVFPEHKGDIPPPTTEEYVSEYFVTYIMGEGKKPGEDYTYGERLRSQIDRAIWMYRKRGFSSNQVILQVAQPSDLHLNDPPCLRHIDTRIRDGTLHFYPYFRSWDLWGGFPANMAALQLLKEYMSREIGVGDGEIVATSKGLHIYQHVEELARRRFNK